jgi:hypothetical protein
VEERLALVQKRRRAFALVLGARTDREQGAFERQRLGQRRIRAAVDGLDGEPRRDRRVASDRVEDTPSGRAQD